MNNAKNTPCDFLLTPTDPKYDESIRIFQGCPTIAITKGGRIFLGWYSGGPCEPHMDNYNILIYSDDKGKTWSKPVVIIPSNKEKCIHALDIQLWTSPEGKLFIFWVQNNVEPTTDENHAITRKTETNNTALMYTDGFKFSDFEHSMWMSVCDNPDSNNLVFSEPRYADTGFLRCKPTVLSNGNWLFFNYDQMQENYGYSISKDNGKTFERHYGAKKLLTDYDESMAYERKDGSVRMFARTLNFGHPAESISYDGGLTWTETKLSDIVHPTTRFFVSRTPSGKVILVTNDSPDTRSNMTVSLSDDDGETWKHKLLIDSRLDLSYPDIDFYDGKIYMVYDRERCGAKEILFVEFTEEDIISGNENLKITIISKP